MHQLMQSYSQDCKPLCWSPNVQGNERRLNHLELISSVHSRTETANPADDLHVNKDRRSSPMETLVNLFDTGLIDRRLWHLLSSWHLYNSGKYTLRACENYHQTY